MASQWQIPTEKVPRFLATVKNLRGIVYFEDFRRASPALKWLARKFQYRLVGISESLVAEIQQTETSKFLTRSPYVTLELPIRAIKQALNLQVQLVEKQPPSPRLLESIALAAAYVCPLLVAECPASGDWGKLELSSVPGPLLSDAEAKRHLRILDYAALDAHEKSTQLVKEALSAATEALPAGNWQRVKRRINAAIKQLAELAQEDGKTRFWRFAQLGTVEAPVVSYVSLLPLLAKSMPTENQGVERLIKLCNQLVWPCLGLVPVMFISSTTLESLSG